MTINNEKDFKIIVNRVDKCFYREKEFPDQVFKDQFSRFIFDGFSDSELPEFWDDVLQPLAKASGDNTVNVIMIDTSLYEYFFNNYNAYCAYNFNINESGENYYQKLHVGASANTSDYPYESAIKIVWIPPSGKWAIYGNKLYEVIILGFSDGFHFTIPKTNCANLVSVSKAIDSFLSFSWIDKARVEIFHEQLLKNYSK